MVVFFLVLAVLLFALNFGAWVVFTAYPELAPKAVPVNKACVSPAVAWAAVVVLLFLAL